MGRLDRDRRGAEGYDAPWCLASTRPLDPALYGCRFDQEVSFRDLKSDGCVRLASLTDSSAEPSGLIFTADGRTAYLAVSHSRDGYMAFTDGFPSDDILKITGFKPLRR